MRKVVLDTTKVQIFKQITTCTFAKMLYWGLFQIPQRYRFSSKSQLGRRIQNREKRCFRYHKGTDFQANHNRKAKILEGWNVVLDTTKVQIFKQITTKGYYKYFLCCCFRYHKGTDFQANHNVYFCKNAIKGVVLDTTKVQIFKQITTIRLNSIITVWLFQIPQRYRFSSKSQQ